VKFYRSEMAGIRKKGWSRRVNAARKEKAMVRDTVNPPAQVKVPPGMKVCSHKDCEHKGKPQPMKAFDNKKNAKDGKQSNCKSCRRRLQRDHKRKIYADAGNANGKPAAPKVDVVAASGSTERHLRDFFADAPTILKRLEWLAERELRTPSNQLIYLIMDATREWTPEITGGK